MMGHSSDRNMLVGILALQLDFIDREQLLAAMNAWVLRKTTPLEEILLEFESLTPDTVALLKALVAKHLELHGNDAQKSLRAISSIGTFQNELKSLADPDIEATLSVVGGSANSDLGDQSTVPHQPSRREESRRFRVIRPHAKGGLGEVFLARDTELNREVALKEIQARYSNSNESRSRFLLEAEVTGGLEHPGIVPVYGLGQYDDGRPFYAMRFIKGDSLKDAIERYHAPAFKANNSEHDRNVDFRKLLGRFIDVCQAIEYAHSRGVLHRDLKPGNIMLGKYGETLVVDWGLAKVVGRTEQHRVSGETTLSPEAGSGSAPTQMGAAIGTPAFMSPEQATGNLDALDAQSDVYSLGATLYCLLTGQLPFQDKSILSLIEKVQRGEFERPRTLDHNISASLEAICLKAMALRKTDRYGSAALLATDIELWLADEPVSCSPEGLATRTRRWAKRNRTLVASGMVAMVLSLAALILGLTLTSIHSQQIAKANTSLSSANAQLQAATDHAVRLANQAEEARKIAEQKTQEATENFKIAENSLYQSNIQFASSRLAEGQFAEADEFLKKAPESLRHIEFELLASQARPGIQLVGYPIFDDSGERVYCSLETHTEVRSCVDGRKLATLEGVFWQIGSGGKFVFTLSKTPAPSSHEIFIAWDGTTWKELFRVQMSEEQVSQIQSIGDYKVAVTQSLKTSIYQLPTGELWKSIEHSIPNSDQSLVRCKFSNNGQLMLVRAGFADPSHLVNVENGQVLRSDAKWGDFSEDSLKLFVRDEEVVIGEDNMAKNEMKSVLVEDALTGRELRRFEGHIVEYLQSDDGEYLVIVYEHGYEIVDQTNFETKMRVQVEKAIRNAKFHWQSEDRKSLFDDSTKILLVHSNSFSVFELWKGVPVSSFPYEVLSVASNINGTILCSESLSEGLNTRESLFTMDISGTRKANIPTRVAKAIQNMPPTFSRDGLKMWFSGGNSNYICDLENPISSWTSRADFSQVIDQGRQVLVGVNNRLSTFNSKDGNRRSVAELPGYFLGANEGGAILVCTDFANSGKLLVIERPTGKVLHRVHHPGEAVTFGRILLSEDGTCLVGSVAEDFKPVDESSSVWKRKETLCVWDLASEHCVRTEAMDARSPISINFGNHGKHVCITWESSGSSLSTRSAEIIDARSGDVMRSFPDSHCVAHPNRDEVVILSNLGLSAYNPVTKVVSGPNPDHLFKVHHGPSMKMVQRGNRILLSTFEEEQFGRVLSVIDTATLATLHRFPMRNTYAEVDMDMTDDSLRVMALSEGKIQIWDTSNVVQILSTDCPNGYYRKITSTPDGKKIILHGSEVTLLGVFPLAEPEGYEIDEIRNLFSVPPVEFPKSEYTHIAPDLVLQLLEESISVGNSDDPIQWNCVSNAIQWLSTSQRLDALNALLTKSPHLTEYCERFISTESNRNNPKLISRLIFLFFKNRWNGWEMLLNTYDFLWPELLEELSANGYTPRDIHELCKQSTNEGVQAFGLVALSSSTLENWSDLFLQEKTMANAEESPAEKSVVIGPELSVKRDFSDAAFGSFFAERLKKSYALLQKRCGVIDVVRSESMLIESKADLFREDHMAHPIIEMGVTEVTEAQYSRFGTVREPRGADFPVVLVSFVEAAEYCNWLTLQAGFGEQECCYAIEEVSTDASAGPEAKSPMQSTKVARLKDNILQLTGYRLPMLNEWIQCADMVSRPNASEAKRIYHFTTSNETNSTYSNAWQRENSQGQLWPVASRLPNANGLFDMYGNVREWCEFDASTRFDVEDRFLYSKRKLPLPKDEHSKGLQFRPVLGGSVLSTTGSLKEKLIHPVAIEAKHPRIGFRVMRRRAYSNVEISPILEAGMFDESSLESQDGWKKSLGYNVGNQNFPLVRASYTSPYDSPSRVQDAYVGFHLTPNNRWTSWNSSNSEDWLEMDFGEPKEFSRIELALYEDTGVKAPSSLRVEVWNEDEWLAVPDAKTELDQPLAGVWNRVSFDTAVRTQKIRIVFVPQQGFGVGVTEWLVWKD